MPDFPSLSTDQVAAFVELSRQGSIRAASEVLHITEQGMRNRLLALEQRLGIQLYRKIRGMRRSTPLTADGHRLLPRAIEFLQRARGLRELFDPDLAMQEVHVAASQYLIYYVLIDAVKRFHARFPQIRIRLSTRTEQEIEAALLKDPDVALGIAAPYESSPDLDYTHLFLMDWSVIMPHRHPLLRRRRVRLAHLVEEPLIVFERGSTGRRHVMEAFHREELSPRVEMEMTNTQIIVRMVEAGLGLAIVPLLPNGVVTRGMRIGIRSLGKQVEPIRSGLLTRRGEPLLPAAREFAEFVRNDRRFTRNG